MDILPQLIANSLIAGGLYAILALGFNLIYGTVKFFDLGYGVMATVGSYGAFFFLQKFGLPLYAAGPIGVFTAGVVGFLVYLLVYKKLRARKASNAVLLVASLGVFTALQAVIAILFTSQFQTLAAGPAAVFEIGGAALTGIQLVIITLSFLLSALVALFLKTTLFGKTVRAVGDDEEVSKIVGVNTNKVIGVVFFIGSAIAGLAGVLFGLDTGLEPTMGLSLLLKAVIASIIGGVGTIYGALAGGFLLGFVENFGIWKISGEWKDTVAFAVLILFLLFRPKGIFKR